MNPMRRQFMEEWLTQTVSMSISSTPLSTPPSSLAGTTTFHNTWLQRIEPIFGWGGGCRRNHFYGR